MKKLFWNEFKRNGLAISILIMIWTVAGCAGAQKAEDSDLPGKKALAAYLDFHDVLVPSDLNLDKKKSFVYETTRSKIGVLVLSGRVDPASLAGFFLNNMQKDGWKLINSLKYREYLLNFVKEDRACLITVEEETFTTTVHIRVGPIEPAGAPEIKIPSSTR